MSVAGGLGGYPRSHEQVGGCPRFHVQEREGLGITSPVSWGGVPYHVNYPWCMWCTCNPDEQANNEYHVGLDFDWHYIRMELSNTGAYINIVFSI